VIYALGNSGNIPVNSTNSIAEPLIKWVNAACYPSWCETGWYSSVAVADLDKDGYPEIIGSAYTIFVLDGETGNLLWKVASGHDRSEPGADNVGRTWPGIVISDLDLDGKTEIVSAHSGGYVSVYNSEGYFEAGWPQRPTDRELRGLSVSDLDSDGYHEIIVTGGVDTKINTWVYEYNGILRSGWPQFSGSEGYASGVYNDNASVGDLNADGLMEIIVPSDVHYISAYDESGLPIAANPIYGAKNWGQVGVWENLDTELRGWGLCDGQRNESYRTNFAHGASVIADVNSDGSAEVVVTGNTYDCLIGHPPAKYRGLYIFNSDRSRFQNDDIDWRDIPVDTGAPLSEDYYVIEGNQPNPVTVDLDGDGNLEILFASYDGKMHAFWLDKTEHGNWPYPVHDPAEGVIRFASEPAVVDLDGDGKAEVIFTSWVEAGSNQTGKLHILDYLGFPIVEVALPEPYGSASWNGALPAPTIDNIDQDADLEIVLNTAHSGFVAYDLPGTENAVIIWGTGRGNYLRNAWYISKKPGSLHMSSIKSSNASPDAGEVITFEIKLENTGDSLRGVTLTDTLPAELDFIGNLWASSGSPTYVNRAITWIGDVSSINPVVIRFDVLVSAQIDDPRAIINQVYILQSRGVVLQRSDMIIINSKNIYTPILHK
jgi:uncharacterized repeat protein (TIGR01451 family)